MRTNKGQFHCYSETMKRTEKTESKTYEKEREREFMRNPDMLLMPNHWDKIKDQNQNPEDQSEVSPHKKKTAKTKISRAPEE